MLKDVSPLIITLSSSSIKLLVPYNGRDGPEPGVVADPNVYDLNAYNLGVYSVSAYNRSAWLIIINLLY